MEKHTNSVLPSSSNALTGFKCPICKLRLTLLEANESEDQQTRIRGELAHTDCYYSEVGGTTENGK